MSGWALRNCVRAVWIFLLLAPPALAEAFPLRVQPALDYPALAAGVAAGGYGYYLEGQASRFDPSRFHAGDIPAYDRWAIGYYSPGLSTLSDVLVLLEGAAPAAFAGADWQRGEETSGEAWTEAVVYGEVVAYASAASLLSKSFRLHPRPLAFTDAAPYAERSAGDARSSFVSEHATGAFAAGVFTAYMYQLKHPQSACIPWVWAGAMGTAAATGALRVFSGKHFPSDVLAGAILGSVVGYAVPRLHLGRNWKSAANSGTDPDFLSRFNLRLRWEPDGFAPALVYRLPG